MVGYLLPLLVIIIITLLSVSSVLNFLPPDHENSAFLEFFRVSKVIFNLCSQEFYAAGILKQVL